MSETQKPISGTPHRDKSDEGYRKGLKSRHMRMIALGGAIGSGLFYGASGRIADGGPSVAIVYAICGGIAYLMLRALGELSLYRPSSGGFISHAREFTISVVGKHIGKRNFPHGIRHGFGHWSIRIFENVVDIPSHGACVIPSLVDADHIIEVRGFHCLMDIEQSDFLGGCGQVRRRRFRVPR